MPPPAAAAPPLPAPAPLAPPLAHILRRKPIYPPLPTNPFYLSDSGDSADEEVLCPNSSETEDDCDGDDDASRQRLRQRRRAKKERILKLAERYIHGEQLYIHCATLRGPVVVSPWRKEKKASADTTTTAATVKEGGRRNGSMMTAGTTPAPQSATMGNSTLAGTAKPTPKSPREPKLKAYFSARKSVTTTINGVTPKTTGRKEKTTVVTVDVRARRARSEAPTTLTERSRRDEELVPDTSFESFSMSQPATTRHVNTTKRAGRDGIGGDMGGNMGNGMEDVSFDETPIGVDIAVRWIGKRDLEKNNDKGWSRVRMVDGSGNGVQNGARRSQSPVAAAYASEQQRDKAELIQTPAVTKKRKRVQLGSPDRGRYVPQTSEEPGTAIDTTNANGADSTTAASEVDWSKKRPRIDFMNLSTPPSVTPIQAISRGDSGPKRRRTEPTPAELKEIQTGSTNARAPPVRSPSHMAELEAIRVNAVKSFLEETESPVTKQVNAGDRGIEKENIETVPKRLVYSYLSIGKQSNIIAGHGRGRSRYYPPSPI